MDVEALLKPISETQACGEDLTFSAEFDAIREARREDDPSLDQGEWVTAIKEAQWPEVVSLCSGLLAERSKDLRLAGWLAEGLAKTEGAAGLARGLSVLAGLIEQHWDEVHPMMEGEDAEERIGSLAWLVTRGKQLAGEFALAHHKGRDYSLGTLLAARELQKQIERGSDEAERIVLDRVTLQQIREAQKATAPALLDRWAGDARAALDALERLDRAADERLRLDGPSFSPMRQVLELYLAEIVAVRPSAPAASGSQVPKQEQGDSGVAGTAVSGSLRNRAEALEQLRSVARYFRETEPHSPVAYLADKAARWGEMPLHVWLKAVLKEEGSMARFEDLLGIEPGDENGA